MNVGGVSTLVGNGVPTVLTNGNQGSGSALAGTTNAASTAGSAQNAAVLQALTATTNGLLPTPDALSSLAGESGVLATLVGGIHSASVANGNPSSPFPGLTTGLASVGGIDSASAATLFSGGSSSGLGGLSAAALNLNASLALASYTNNQAGLPTGNFAVAADAAATSPGSTSPADVQSAIQSAQSSVLTSTMNLLG